MTGRDRRRRRSSRSQVAAPGSAAANPAFDVTPARLVTGDHHRARARGGEPRGAPGPLSGARGARLSVLTAARQGRAGAVNSLRGGDLCASVMTLTLRAAIGSLMSIASEQAAPKRDTLNLRISPAERELIDQAARLTGKTRTDFVLEAARRAAEDALLDRVLFTLSPHAYADFVARLDAAPQPNDRLRRLMQTPAPWGGVTLGRPVALADHSPTSTPSTRAYPSAR